MRRADNKICSTITQTCRVRRSSQRASFFISGPGHVLLSSASRNCPPQYSTRSCSTVRTKPASSKWYGSTLDLSSAVQRPFTKWTRSDSWLKGTDKPAESGSPQSFDFQPMDIPEENQADTEHLPTRRVHILGLGSIGTLLAHSLQCMPNAPPISLLMHRPNMYEQFKENGRIVRLVNPNTDVNDEQFGFDVDLLRADEGSRRPYWEHIPHRWATKGEPQAVNKLEPGETLDSGEVFIYTLVVSVKGPATVRALQSVKHRINSQTTVLLLQNGMGQVEELNKKVFTDPKTRPTYLLGIISHGAYMSGPFNVVHAGFGTTALGIYRDVDKYPLPPRGVSSNPSQLSEEQRMRMFPTDKELYSNLSSRYLLRTMTRCSVLACAAFPYLDLFQLQLEKLVMNCVVNPLTAILNIPNGSMLGNTSCTRAERLLLAEISLVLRRLPELEGVPGVNARFSPARLEALCHGIARKTAKNSSSMREDVRHLRATEVDYISGYLVRRGEELGIKCVLNYFMATLINAKTEASTSGEIKPYGTTSIEDGRLNPGADAEDVVNLEDRGTQLKGKSY